MIWQLAGILGVDPGPLTLRQLLWMIDAHRREAWHHTSAVLATLANIHRDPKKKPRPFAPADFHPLTTPKVREKPIPADITVLKKVFVRE